MEKLPSVEIAERSDPGRDPTKQINEDCCRSAPTSLGHLIVTCDGMGGHEGGREASHLAVATIFEVVLAAPPGSPPGETLKRAIETANQRVHSLAPAGHDATRPGSTVVAVLLHKNGAEVAHVGDSRVYLLHGESATQVTHDHSMVQQMVDAGLITQEEAAHHPNANQISRALGMKADVEVELRKPPVAYVAGDVFLLCSDGLCDLVKAEEMLKIAGSAPVAQAAGQLVDLANARGGHDNITVQLVRAKESAAVQPVAPTVTDGVGKTVIDTPRLTTERPPPGPAAKVAAGPATLPRAPASTTVSGGSRMSWGLIAGLVLALAGIGVAIAVGYLGVRKREKHVPSFVAEDAAPHVVPNDSDAQGNVAPSVTPMATATASGSSSSEPHDAAPSLAPLVTPDAAPPVRKHRPPPPPVPTPLPTESL